MLELVRVPDKRLHMVSTPMEVDLYEKKYKKLFLEMLDFMYENNGVGLAGVQVGVMKNILVIDVSKNKNRSKFIANPKIVSAKGEIMIDEGCLSIPGKSVKVKRFSDILVECIDGKTGNLGKFLFTGFEAIAVQHEMDHLVGKIITDYEG